jgi:hypothetical protein
MKKRLKTLDLLRNKSLTKIARVQEGVHVLFADNRTQQSIERGTG